MGSSQYLTGDSAAIDAFIDKFDTFLFDCDGVIWRETTKRVMDGVPKTINLLLSKGKKVIYVTNASAVKRDDMYARCIEAGIAASLSDMYTSGYSAALYIKNVLNLSPGREGIFLIGTPPIHDELESAGITVYGGKDKSKNRPMSTTDNSDIADGKILHDDVGAVLFCWDPEPSMLKYNVAYAYLQRGAEFMVSGADTRSSDTGHETGRRGWFLANGSMAAPLVKASGITPTVLGKPSAIMMDAVESNVSLDRARTCMVGDNLETDIEFGIKSKLGGTLAVLTGVAQKEDFLVSTASTVPAYYVDGLADIGAGASGAS